MVINSYAFYGGFIGIKKYALKIKFKYFKIRIMRSFLIAQLSFDFFKNIF